MTAPDQTIADDIPRGRGWWRSLRSRLGVLRHRNFALYFTGQTLSVFGDAFVPLALAFGVLAHGSATDLGLVLFANRAPVIALVLLGGVAGDRLRGNRVMLAADGVRCLSQGLTAVLFIAGRADIGLLMALQAVHGTAAAFFGPAANSVIPETVANEQVKEANALLGLSRNAVQLLAIALSAAVVVAVGPGWAMAVDSATFAASALSLALLHLPSTAARLPKRPGVLPQLTEGWGYVRSHRWLWVLIGHVSLVNTVAIAPFLVLGPLVAKRFLGGPASWAAIAAAYLVGAIVGGAISLRLRPRYPLRTALLAVFALLPVFVLLAMPGPVWAICLAAALAGVEATVYGTFTTTTLQTRVPGEMRARVGSYQLLGSLILVPTGLALTGPLALAIGESPVLWLACLFILALTGIALLEPGIRGLDASGTGAAGIGRGGS